MRPWFKVQKSAKKIFQRLLFVQISFILEASTYRKYKI